MGRQEDSRALIPLFNTAQDRSSRTMVSHNFRLTFNLGPCKAGEENDGFSWIRRHSPVAKYLTGVDFSYRSGFTVECFMPHDIDPYQMSALFFDSYKAFQSRPWNKCSPAGLI